MQALLKFIVLKHLYPKEQILSENTLLKVEVNVYYSANSFSIAKGQGQLYQTRLLNIDTQEELYLLFKLYQLQMFLIEVCTSLFLLLSCYAFCLS